MSDDELNSLDNDLSPDEDPSVAGEIVLHTVKIFDSASGPAELSFQSGTRTVERNLSDSQTMRSSESLILADGSHALSHEDIKCYCCFYKPGQMNKPGCGPVGDTGLTCSFCHRNICYNHSKLHTGNGRVYCLDCFSKVRRHLYAKRIKRLILFPFRFIYSLILNLVFPTQGDSQ